MPAILPLRAQDPASYSRMALMPLAKAALDSALQPIVETVSGKIYGYEALMRGHDELGFDAPMALLDAFAMSGELTELELFTTSRAFAKFTTLAEFERRTIFLNLDHRLLLAGQRLLPLLLSYLQKNSISPSSVCVELSERSDNASVPDFANLIGDMRRMGFKLAIDDFGTGHAEMKLISDYDLDYLKIDRHLISRIDAVARKRHLTKTVVDMAHVLGLRVIAEGVETEGEFLVCRDLGVDLVQGWFVARPSLDPAEFRDGFPHLRDLGQNRRVRRSVDEVLVRQQVEAVPTIREDAPIETLFEIFGEHSDQPFIPVVNAHGEPRGIVQEARLKSYIYQPFGRDLLQNRFYGGTIARFIDPAPVVDIGADSSRLMAVFSGTEDAKCVILTENMRYAGVISAGALVKIINAKLVRQAQDQNPLTGLPGNQAIHSYLEETMADGGVTRHYCYCDFDNFKPFNDHYGFQRGDDAISLFARLMKRYFFSPSVFLGHVGGDDFFAGISGWSSEEVEMIFERLLDDFETDALRLYSPEDRERGHILGIDRAGVSRAFEFLSCSVAVIEVPAGRVFGDPAVLSAHIAGLKKRVKSNRDGLLFETI
ncbi:GGDEF domain-containing protein [Rhizobium sp. C1]|uniref:GGDEF domain-containing protein n=1 Tax=Rhizobium sp. C1 TaxID=1349799 RepID=UPI001E379614|nr:GGDEF domain-containing protein [Rhizobium sp. C1]MCD2177400.1 GGDEF domain-containing protein [Rhizobium sp. C1]